MDNLSVFGQRVKQLRQELSLSQRDFAEKIGITASALSSYEKGLKNPSVNVAINIALAFDTSMDWLCGLKQDTHRFRPDKIISYDLPSALRGILNLLHSGVLTVPELEECEGYGVLDTDVLCIENGALKSFVNDSHQLELLYANNSISYENFKLCADEMVYKVAEDIRRISKGDLERLNAQLKTLKDDELPF